MTVVGADTQEALAGIAAGDLSVVEGSAGLDGRTFALVNIAVLIALDAPPSSYTWQVSSAIEEGVTAEELLEVLCAVAPQVGSPRVVAAAPRLMAAIGLPVEDHCGAMTRLAELGRLHDQGFLTDDEHAAQKARILGAG